jgi:hypothetical protein
VCKLHGLTYKENHGFGIAEEAEWIEFQADGDTLDQGGSTPDIYQGQNKIKSIV